MTLGGVVDGSGGSATAAERVVEETALAAARLYSGVPVTDFGRPCRSGSMDAWGHTDALVCNAGDPARQELRQMDLWPISAWCRTCT